MRREDYMKTVCKKCNNLFQAYWLKNGLCNGCRNPNAIVEEIPSPECVLTAEGFETYRNGWAGRYRDVFADIYLENGTIQAVLTEYQLEDIVAVHTIPMDNLDEFLDYMKERYGRICE